MKKIIIIPLLLFSVYAFSQGSNITYILQGANPATTDSTTNLKLPLKLVFTDKFNGKNIKFMSEDGTQPLALNNAKFGFGDLTKDGETNQFVIIINQDRTVDPGGEKINEDKFILQIEQTEIILSLRPVESMGETGNSKKDEAYEAGYIYYDALKLTEKLKNNPNDKSIAEILKAYGIDAFNIDNNPYINDVFGNYFDGRPQGGGAVPFLTNLGNIDVTYFAEGVARFLAERTKEELNEVFFNKMKEKLNAYPELKTAFPNTASFLNVIETYSYANVIQTLKQAFETDVQNLPENLYKIKNLKEGDCDKVAICGENSKNDCDDFENCKARLIELSKFFTTQNGRWIGLGMFTLRESFQSSNPADLFDKISISDELKGIKHYSLDSSKYDNYNVASSIELANLISYSLRSKQDNQIWITSRQLDSLINIKNAFKVYLGLLLAYEQMGKARVLFYKSKQDSITFGEILKEAYKTYAKHEPDLKSLIKNSQTAFNAANNAVKKIIAGTEKSTEIEPQVLYNYYRTLTRSLKPIAHNKILSEFTRINTIDSVYDKIEMFLNPSVDIAYHISTKMYSAAIYDASILLNSLNDYKIITRDRKAITKEENYNEFKTVTNSFVKYGTLISTVANAQSSDEVKQAIEASVLPVGSSSIKRKSAWSISVNGYVGGFYGKAHSISADTVMNKSKNKLDTITTKVSYRTFGLYAPIGISFNRGFKCGWGVSFTAQVLDLGALVDFYLTEGDQAALPNDFKVKLADILSPGIQLAINFPKTPLTLMGGIQYVPALSNKSQIVSNTLSPMAWRGQVALLVDIPMYNLKVWDFKR